MTIEQLRASRASKIAAMQTLIDSVGADSEMTAEQTTQYDALMAEQEGLKTQIARVEAQTKLNTEMKAPVTKPVHTPVATTVFADAELIDDANGFASLGEFMSAVKSGTDPRLEFVAEQTAGTGSEGGYLIPRQFGAMIMAFEAESSIVRSRATVIPGGEYPDAEISFPALDQSGAKGVYSGVVTTWLAEGATIDQTSFSLREIKMAPKGIAGYIAFSNKLLRNSDAASTIGAKLLRDAISKAEDDAFISGDGVGKPLGFLNHASAKIINRNTALTVKFIDLANMVQSSKGDKKEWVISQTLYAVLRVLEDGSGRLIFSDGTAGMPPMLLGFPVRWSERTPTKGVKGDVMLLDLSYYYVKDGSGLLLSASEHVQFLSDKTVFKVTKSVDGQSSMNGKLTLENGETVSPFVILDVPAV